MSGNILCGGPEKSLSGALKVKPELCGRTQIAEVPKMWNTFQGELQTGSVISQAEKSVLQELKLKGTHEA